MSTPAHPRIQKKICLLGTLAVGKTSLVRRFVQNMFSDQYKTTLGVKIDKKSVWLNNTEIVLMIWDIAGEDEFFEVPEAYLAGSSGYLLILDGTRKSTWPAALALQEKAARVMGPVPFVLLLNKSDLADQWELDDDVRQEITRRAWVSENTSAKTGQGVEAVFVALAKMMIQPQSPNATP